MSSKNDDEINWNEVVGKEALGENGLDIGTIKDISDDYIVTEVGMLKKKIYHLPKTSAKYFNGVFLNFSLKESDLPTYEQKIKENILNNDPFSESLNKATKKEELSIPLISEDLQVTKTIAEDNIKIVKEPIKETKTVELELLYDKVTIMKRPSKGNASLRQTESNAHKLESNSPGIQIDTKEGEEEDWRNYDKSTEIIVTLEREEPNIVKKSHVKEEILVKKQTLFETKTITEQVIHEYLKSNDVELKR